MDTDDPYPGSPATVILSVINQSLSAADTLPLLFTGLGLMLLIGISALSSGAENALFSLTNKDLETISEKETPANKAIIKLLSDPKKLLATILTLNNFVNVGFVIISSHFFLERIFDFEANRWLDILVNLVLITLVLLLFGEVIPKIYATRHNYRMASLMALPLLFVQKLFYPIVGTMVNLSSFIDRKIQTREHTVSADELTHAIDITTGANSPKDEKEILKGIINFGNKFVKQIMKSRVDVAAIDMSLSFDEVIAKIHEWGYSRMPVYDESFDNITGIIYIKEILPHLHESTGFNWHKLIKPAFFVPDNKKIDVLLSEFQDNRIHMAIVVDEYGGKLGIVTMEDILEEIFGEINDEFDEEPLNYSKLDDHRYVFEGKFLINDFCRVTGVDAATFEDIKGEAETMGGLLLEIAGHIPARGEMISYKQYKFTIESVDNRRIKRIKAEIGKTA